LNGFEHVPSPLRGGWDVWGEQGGLLAFSQFPSSLILVSDLNRRGEEGSQAF